MFELTKKDVVLNGDIIRTWTVDYEEFDLDMDASVQQALLTHDGNYYVVELDSETGDAIFPLEHALVLDIQTERINNTFIWNQIQDFIPDEDVEIWDDSEFDEDSWDWDADSE